jgi:hypothetical protein
MLARMYKNWRSRHLNKTSFALHMVGIPATVAAIVPLVMGHWGWAIALFVGGYALQFLGHMIEGNKSGEELLLRKILHRP